ncbi:MAG: hypothetical protein HY535_06080 [Chloroflexi bacterium]|nr:hypothetical protein [Chloroflexota bacterium]
MTSLQFLVDSMCANFTVESIYALVKTLLAERPCTIGDIAQEIAAKDRSLDIKSAQAIAEAAVEAMSQRGALEVQGPYIYPGSAGRGQGRP